MTKYIVNEKLFRKKMIDLNIKSISELASKAGVSKPTIYEYFKGKNPFFDSFIKLCNYLEIDPLIALEDTFSDKE